MACLDAGLGSLCFVIPCLPLSLSGCWAEMILLCPFVSQGVSGCWAGITCLCLSLSPLVSHNLDHLVVGAPEPCLGFSYLQEHILCGVVYIGREVQIPPERIHGFSDPGQTAP